MAQIHCVTLDEGSTDRMSGPTRPRIGQVDNYLA